MTHRRIVVVLIASAVLGIGLFGFLGWRSITVETMGSVGAENSFEQARASLTSLMPLVQRDATGHFVRRRSADARGPAPTQLHVLAYYADGQRLVRGDVPLWFFKVKGPAVAYALRGTGFELEALSLTAADLERAGAGVVLDETRPTGDRILAWTN